jgi:hypothetical protein
MILSIADSQRRSRSSHDFRIERNKYPRTFVSTTTHLTQEPRMEKAQANLVMMQVRDDSRMVCLPVIRVCPESKSMLSALERKGRSLLESLYKLICASTLEESDPAQDISATAFVSEPKRLISNRTESLPVLASVTVKDFAAVILTSSGFAPHETGNRRTQMNLMWPTVFRAARPRVRSERRSDWVGQRFAILECTNARTRARVLNLGRWRARFAILRLVGQSIRI